MSFRIKPHFLKDCKGIVVPSTQERSSNQAIKLVYFCYLGGTKTLPRSDRTKISKLMVIMLIRVIKVSKIDGLVSTPVVALGRKFSNAT